MAGEKNFKILFFRHYDRKIAEGSITFSKLEETKEMILTASRRY